MSLQTQLATSWGHSQLSRAPSGMLLGFYRVQHQLFETTTLFTVSWSETNATNTTVPSRWTVNLKLIQDNCHPKNPDPSKQAILEIRTPAIQVQTLPLEGPSILRAPRTNTVTFQWTKQLSVSIKHLKVCHIFKRKALHIQNIYFVWGSACAISKGVVCIKRYKYIYIYINIKCIMSVCL